MFQRFVLWILWARVLSKRTPISFADAAQHTNGVVRRGLQDQADDLIVTNTKLVLTPQSNGLSEAATSSLVTLLDQTLFNYAQLTQSLSVGRGLPERKISHVSSRKRSQMIDSVFVLGASDAYQTLVGETRARTLLRGDKEAYQPSGQRSQADDSPAGVIVSSLELDLSTSFALEETEAAAFSVPDATSYIHDFFAIDSTTGASFVNAAKEIVDEYGQKPLSGLRYIGVGDNILWSNPYTFIDEQSQLPGMESRSYGPGETPLTNTNSSLEQSLPWMAIAIVFSFVAFAVIIGALIFVLSGARNNRELSRQKVLEEIAQNENRLMALPAVASPISISFDEDLGSNQSSKEDSSTSTDSSSKKRASEPYSGQQRKKLKRFCESSEGSQAQSAQLSTSYENGLEATQEGYVANSGSHETRQADGAMPADEHDNTVSAHSGSRPTKISDHDGDLNNVSTMVLSKDSIVETEENQQKESSQPSLEASPKKPSVSWTGTLTSFLSNAAAGLQEEVSLQDGADEDATLDHERLQDQKQQDYAYFSVERPKSPRRVRSDNLYVIPEDDASV